MGLRPYHSEKFLAEMQLLEGSHVKVQGVFNAGNFKSFSQLLDQEVTLLHINQACTEPGILRLTENSSLYGRLWE